MTDRKLELSGVVDMYPQDVHINDISPSIGGENVIVRLNETFGQDVYDKPNVKAYLGVEPVAEGPLWALTGFGGTDVTPPELPEIRVGGLDLIDKLRELEGREVALVVTEVALPTGGPWSGAGAPSDFTVRPPNG